MDTSFHKKALSFLGIEFNPVSHREKIISAAGGFLGIFMVAWVSFQFIDPRNAMLIVASMGASAVLLFAVPHSPLAQPWPTFGGHIVSSIIGVTCMKLVPDALVAGALSVSLAVGAMHYLRCIHPPGGATSLTPVVMNPELQTMGYQFVVTPVLINVLILLIVAIAFNYAFPWRRYPSSWARQKTDTVPLPPVTVREARLGHKDLEYALTQMGSFIDVTEDDLAQIFNLASRHARSDTLDPSQIQPGHYYSNGRYGDEWAIRRVLERAPGPEGQNGLLTYQVVAGKGHDDTQNKHCSTEDFAHWARYEVRLEGASWKRVNNDS